MRATVPRYAPLLEGIKAPPGGSEGPPPVCPVRTLLTHIHDGVAGTFRAHVRVIE